MPEFERPVLVADSEGESAGGSIESRRGPLGFGQGADGSGRGLVGLVAVGIAAAIAFGIAAEPGAPAAAPEPHRVVLAEPTPRSSPSVRPLLPSRSVMPTRPAPLSISLPPVTVNLPGAETTLDVGSSGYAAVTSFDCHRPAPCVGGLAVSSDLRHWTRRRLPSDALWYGARYPVVLGPGTVLLQSDGLWAWYTSDGGRTWRTVSAATGPEAPDATGGRLMVERPSTVPVVGGRQPTRGPCDGNRLVVYRRDTGERMPLRRQPLERLCSVTADRRGRLWAAGLGANSGDLPLVAVSTDAGAHWTTTRLPEISGAWTVTVAPAGSEAYAVATFSGPADRRPTLPAVYRYRGGHWTPVWAAFDAGPNGIDQPIVCPRGRLLSTWAPPGEEPRDWLMVSLDSGRHWYRAAGLTAISAQPMPGGTGWYGYYQDRPVYSYDCGTWYGIPVG